MNTQEKATLAFIVALLVLFAGWINNVIWTFHQTDTGSLALGILGAVLGPIGSLHGIYLWFV